MSAPTAAERLDLADWRRRVADLYADVRREATVDPERAWQRWRSTREELFKTHAQSPVPAAQRGAFRAAHWPYDPRYRVEANLSAEPDRAGNDPAPSGPSLGAFSVSLPMSTGGEEGFSRIGWFEVAFPAGIRSLGVYWMAGYAGGLFLPFRDATNGHETYGAGRYLLDTAKSADLGAVGDELILDFNFAYHPSCRYDPKWVCPLAPPGNRLQVAIEAGERM